MLYVPPYRLVSITLCSMSPLHTSLYNMVQISMLGLKKRQQPWTEESRAGGAGHVHPQYPGRSYMSSLTQVKLLMSFFPFTTSNSTTSNTPWKSTHFCSPCHIHGQEQQYELHAMKPSRLVERLGDWAELCTLVWTGGTLAARSGWTSPAQD